MIIFATNISHVSKYYEVSLNITNFAIISLVSGNTITSVAVNCIQTNSSILTRIWVTVIFIYNDITKRLRIINKLSSKKKIQRCDQFFNKHYNKLYIKCFKKYEVMLNITDFAIISAVSRNTITSISVYFILTYSSVLTRI